METNFDTTVTDKKNFNVPIVDTDKYAKLSDTEKEAFLLLRNSMLEIMPIDTDNYNTEALRYAENYAYINYKGISKCVEAIVDKKMNDFESKINKILATLSTTTSTTKL